MSSYVKSSISPSRVLVLDFIRLAAMLLMIQGHTLDALVDPGRMDLGAFGWQTWVHLRGLTAPIFMMVSGAATVMGIRYDADGRVSEALFRHRVRIALAVMGIGYLMVFPANRLADLQWVSPEIWHAFLRVNILQANGVTLLLLTGLLHRVRSVRRYAFWSVGAGLLILLAAPLAASVDWFRWLPEGLASYLSYDHGSLFPLVPTSAYMFLGVGLGALLRETSEARRARAFRLACLAAGALSLLVALAAQWGPLESLPAPKAYQGAYAFTAFRLGFSLLVMGVLGWVAEAWPRMVAALSPLGRKSLSVYVGHLALIFGTPWTPGLAHGRFHALTVGSGALFVLLVGSLTFGAILLWDWIRSASRRMETLIQVTAVLALAFALVW